MTNFVSLGEMEALSDGTGAMLVRRPGSNMQAAVDSRVQPLVIDTVANNPDVVQAAADLAQSDAGLARVDVHRNLVDPSLLVAESFILPGGVVDDFSGHTTTGYIPVKAGVSYTGRVMRARALYTSAKVFIAGTYHGDQENDPITITPTQDGFLRASTPNALLGDFQIEEGTVATDYIPFGRTLEPVTIPASYIVEDRRALQVSRVGNTINTVSLLGDDRLDLGVNLDGGFGNPVFNFAAVRLDNVLLSTAGDDVAPIVTQQGAVGANHGFETVRAYQAGSHDKTTADLGSKWTDGAREYVLLQIRSDGALVIGGDWVTLPNGAKQSVATIPAGPLTHVSGATNTAPITVGGAATQLRPSVQRVLQRVTVDGNQLVGNASTSGAVLRVKEAYDILDYAALYDLAAANVGVPFTDLDVPAAMRLESDWQIRPGGRVVGELHLTELQPTAIGYWDGVQAGLAAGVATRYLPGVKPINGLDWSAGVPIGNLTATQYPAIGDLHNPDVPPATLVDVAPDYAVAIGLDPWFGDAASDERLASTPDQLWWLASTKKIYARAVGAYDPGWGRISVRVLRAHLTAEEAADVLAQSSDAGFTSAALFTLM